MSILAPQIQNQFRVRLVDDYLHRVTPEMVELIGKQTTACTVDLSTNHGIRNGRFILEIEQPQTIKPAGEMISTIQFILSGSGCIFEVDALNGFGDVSMTYKIDTLNGKITHSIDFDYASNGSCVHDIEFTDVLVTVKLPPTATDSYDKAMSIVT